MKIQVELAVCFEDGTWGLENVEVNLLAPLTDFEGDIWEAAVEQFWLDHPDSQAVALGLYHYQAEESNE